MPERQRKPLPPEHLAPRNGFMRGVDPKNLAFRAKTGILRGPLGAWRRARAKAYWANPNAQTFDALLAVEREIGQWIGAPDTSFDQFIVINNLDAVPRGRAVVPAWGSPHAWVTPAPSAQYKMFKGKRFLGIAIGGVGDTIIYSQVVRSLRAKGIHIDIAHRQGSTSLIEKLFAPGEVVKFPARQDQLDRYDGFFPLGMHRVSFGETMGEYLERVYGVPYEPTGFTFSDDTIEDTDRLLKLKHGFDLDRGVVFLQARGRAAKHYPGLEAVAERLSQRHQVAVIGSLSDSTITDRPGALANLCGWSIWDTMCAMRHARVLVGPDSSFLHAAGAMRKPSVIIFGPSPRFWAPYPECTTISYAATCRFHPCWVMTDAFPPCGQYEKPPCMTQIDVDDVVKAAEMKLEGRAPEHIEVPRIPNEVVIQRRI